MTDPSTSPTVERLDENRLSTADHIPCDERRGTPPGERVRPAHPKRPESGPPIGVTLSGGGFRATFAALGVIRYLADVDLLGNLWISSSVSGGSVANGIIATNWPDLRTKGFSADAVDRVLIEPTVKQVAKKSLKTHLIKNVWRTIGSKTRTDLLAWAFDDWFVGDTQMHELDPGVRWVINAANMATGTRYTFERDIIGDYVNGFVRTDTPAAQVKVALAAAASAAVPGAFAPVTLDDLRLPCQGVDTVSLLDGGAYDNTGIEVLDSPQYDDVFTICLAAGGIFKVGPYGKMPLIRDLTQANSVLYRESRNLRTRDMVQRFLKTERRGAVFKLNTSEAAVKSGIAGTPSMTPEQKAEAVARVDDFVARYPARDFIGDQEIAFVGTSFDKFDKALSMGLVRKGWWVTGLTMAGFNGDLAPLPTSVAAPG